MLRLALTTQETLRVAATAAIADLHTPPDLVRHINSPAS